MKTFNFYSNFYNSILKKAISLIGYKLYKKYKTGFDWKSFFNAITNRYILGRKCKHHYHIAIYYTLLYHSLTVFTTITVSL